VPSAAAAGSAGRGDGDAGLDGDLVGVRSDGDLDGLTGIGQANLDLSPPYSDGHAKPQGG
jgi:hypothetical protein